jgi:RNA 3'-terminal phosphate cyclase
MIELDGSFGEGGGQILRTSLALSLSAVVRRLVGREIICAGDEGSSGLVHFGA